MGNLQQTLKIGNSLPVWGEAKNRPSKKEKEYLQEIFNEGQKSKPIPPAEVVIMMQEKLDDVTGEPVFDADTFLDEGGFKIEERPPY